jgi:drug/metabolite transporter (DMT)-like permease
MVEKRKAYIAAIVYAFIIGLSFMFVKITLTVAGPLDTLAHRFTVAWIVATIFVLLNKGKLKISWRDVRHILPLAFLYPIIFFTFQVFGLARITSSEAGMIQATVPIFTLVFASVILKEKATREQLVFMNLSVLGVIFLLVMNGAGTGMTNLVGSGIILLSAIAAALYNIFARKLTQQYSLLTLTYVMTLFGFVVFNIIAIGSHVIDGTTRQYFHPFMHVNFVLAILYLGIFSSLITSYLSNYALSKIEASQMSVFSNFATLITIVAGVIFLQEDFHLYHLIGAIVIIIGVVGTNYFGARSTHNEKI